MESAGKVKRRSKRGGNATFDGTVICPCSMGSDLTATSSQLAGSISVDAANNTIAMGSGGTTIANNYMEYRYKDLEVEWLPHVAPGVSAGGGRVYVAYLDNPEQITVWLANTVANNVVSIKTIRGVAVFNAWERFTYKPKLTYRRPWFDVNLTTTNTVDILDRSTQGLIVFAAETVGATDVIGTWQCKSRVVLRGYHGSLAT